MFALENWKLETPRTGGFIWLLLVNWCLAALSILSKLMLNLIMCIQMACFYKKLCKRFLEILRVNQSYTNTLHPRAQPKPIILHAANALRRTNIRSNLLGVSFFSWMSGDHFILLHPNIDQNVKSLPYYYSVRKAVSMGTGGQYQNYVISSVAVLCWGTRPSKTVGASRCVIQYTL